MTTSRLLLTIVSLLVAGWAATAGHAETFHFNVVDGTWRLPANWLEPNGPPGPGDIAIIGSGKTCRIEGSGSIDDGAAKDVQVSGTLRIVGARKLTISDAAASSLTVNSGGIVEFHKSAGNTPQLLYGGTFTIDGSGTVQALGQSGHAGIIDNISGSSHILEIESGVTVKGSLTIECDNAGTQTAGGMKLDGIFVVDNSLDQMAIGVNSSRWVRGSGTFDAVVERLRFSRKMDGYRTARAV